MNLTATTLRGTWTTDAHTCRFKTGPAMSDLVSKDVTSTAMNLAWKFVPGVEFYELNFIPSINSDGSPLIVRDNSTYVTDLVSDVQYQISICGKSDLFHTDSIQFNQFTAPSAPVLIFPKIKSRRLDLIWTELPEDYYYLLDVVPRPAGYEDLLPMQTWANSETITGLLPETMYTFTVRAVSEERALVTDQFSISQMTG